MENRKRVYLLGAVVNKSLKYHKNESETFFPPLSKNFFHIALQIIDHIEYGYNNCCGLLTAYIEKYSNKQEIRYSFLSQIYIIKRRFNQSLKFLREFLKVFILINFIR